jgi:hypothetical protein
MMYLLFLQLLATTWLLTPYWDWLWNEGYLLRASLLHKVLCALLEQQGWDVRNVTDVVDCHAPLDILLFCLLCSVWLGL